MLVHLDWMKHPEAFLPHSLSILCAHFPYCRSLNKLFGREGELTVPISFPLHALIFLPQLLCSFFPALGHKVASVVKEESL